MFESNLKKIGKIVRSVRRKCILFFKKKLKTCSGDQNWLSFHGPGSGRYHDGHTNSSISLCKFAYNLPMINACRLGVAKHWKVNSIIIQIAFIYISARVTKPIAGVVYTTAGSIKIPNKYNRRVANITRVYF